MPEKISKYYFLLILFSLLIFKSEAQLFNFKQYNVENGFPQSNANHIFQDSKGFIWFATQNGAAKFDGFTYEVYDKSTGLAGNIIHNINEDLTGNFWIASKSGLTKIRNKTYKSFTTKDGLYSNYIISTCITPDNKILVCTYEGANIIENDKIKKLPHTAKPIQFLVRKNKEIWALSSENIYVLKFNTFKIIEFDKAILKPPYQCIAEGNDSTLWVSGKNGLFHITGKNIRHFSETDGLISNDINCVMVHSDNNVWYSSEKEGCGIFDGKEFKNFTAEQGMTNTSVLCLLEDSEKNVWIGGRNGATMVDTRVPFIHYNRISPYKNEIVMGMAADEKNNIWFCTYGFGLFKYDGRNYISFTRETGSIDNHFFDIEIDDSGLIWLASGNNGIITFNGKTFNKVNLNIKKRVLTIFQDSDKNLWFGTNGEGIINYKGKKFIKYSKDSEFGAGNVMSIQEDEEHNIWFGTIDEGLIKFDGKKFINIDKKENINTGIVRAISNVKGTLWFGTASNGIFRLGKDKGKTKMIFVNRSDGLNSNNVYLTYFDSKDNLWIGTEKGVDKIRFDKNNRIKSIKNYTINEGFIGVETNLNASLEDHKGDIWFGTINGALKYNKNADKKNTVENKTYIKGIRLFFEEYDFKEYCDKFDSFGLPVNLTLPHNLNHLSFDFIGLCFSNPQKIKYKYRLIGQNKDWSPATDDNKAVFTNIEPGNYEFQVISANNDGLWNKEPVRFKFTIDPPFWSEIWFKTLILLIVLVMIFFLIQIRSKSLLRAKLILEKRVSERTSQLIKQKEKLEHSNIKIKDSINYAGKIQSAMLPQNNFFTRNFSDHFIMYRPRDIISGDFYWAKELVNYNGSYIVTVVADCTGHGIPGALVSMLGMSLLNEIIRKKEITSANQVLEELRKDIKTSLKQTGNIEEQSEGIDMAISVIERNSYKLQYSGANIPLYLIRNNKLTIFKPTINPVGIFIKELPFKNNIIELKKNDTLYMFTDGFIDQFSDESGEKFKIKRLRKLLTEISNKNMFEQKQILEDTFSTWKGNYEQIDDVLVMGLRIK